MSKSPPTPPTELPGDLARALADRRPDVLRAVASYATELAEYRERESNGEQTTSEDDESDAQLDGADDDRPESVPAKATVTVKEINDNRYYYWQWRDGEQIKSKYKGPVSSDE